MRILFTLPGNGSRTSFVNGYTMRYGSAGLSGTDTTTILVAEYLASLGNDIVVLVEKSPENLLKIRDEKGYQFIPGEKINGVTYSYFDLEGIDNRVFDIWVNSLWFGDYDSLDVIVTRAICYWCHLAWGYYLNPLQEYARKHNLKLAYISISEWARNHHKENIEFLKSRINDVYDVTIPNMMTIDVMDEVCAENLERVPKKIIFPAQWSRGASVAIKAARELGLEDNFKSFDYVNLSTGIDKQTLFRELATSEYFLFPQYTEGNKCVYKDVHSCAVGEAIGMGVIVISYPLGSHEEHYKDHYFKLYFPPDIDMDKMMSEAVTEEPKMDYHQNLVEAVKFLEANPYVKDDIRERGKKYIRDTFHPNKIGPMWVNLFNSLCISDSTAGTDIANLESEEHLVSTSNNITIIANDNTEIISSQYMNTNPFDFFDKIFYINLDSRPDRREHIESTFARLNINAERFSAITITPEQNEILKQEGCLFRGEQRPEHARYIKSCTLSHLSVIFRAKLMNYKNVLIFEDDVIFREDVLEELSKALNDLQKMDSWDMFYIGCNPFKYKKVTDHLGQCLGALTAHAYAVNNHFYNTILNIPFKALPCIDMFYHSLATNPNNKLYMALQNLAWQMPSYSTLEEQDVDYYPSIQARYDSNIEIE